MRLFPSARAVLAKSVEFLARALIATGDEEDLALILRHMQADPARFSLPTCRCLV